MRRSPRPEGRMTSISPALTTKKGTFFWPLSINTSPRVIGRTRPWEAIRAICSAVSAGNRSDAVAPLESSVERSVSVTIVSRPVTHADLREPLDEREGFLGDLAPAGVDRQRVSPPRHLDDLGHALVALLLLVGGVR